MSGRMWKAVETGTGEVGMGEIKGRRGEGGDREKKRRNRKEREQWKSEK